MLRKSSSVAVSSERCTYSGQLAHAHVHAATQRDNCRCNGVFGCCSVGARGAMHRRRGRHQHEDLAQMCRAGCIPYEWFCPQAQSANSHIGETDARESSGRSFPTDRFRWYIGLLGFKNVNGGFRENNSRANPSLERPLCSEMCRTIATCRPAAWGRLRKRAGQCGRSEHECLVISRVRPRVPTGRPPVNR